MNKLFLLIVLLLSACGPSQAEIQSTVQASIAQTQEALPTATNTAKPTNTPKPTSTKRPTPTRTPAPSVDEVRENLLDAVAQDLSTFQDIESVSVIRFNEGALEIELKTVWASRDRQPDVSWEIVSFFAGAFAGFDKENLELVAGGPFSIALTTYSTDGNYRYQSVTDWDTLQKLSDKSISFDEWSSAANAGFR
jgi:hypothetical protein